MATRLGILLVLLLEVATTRAASFIPGDLDGSFGTEGIVLTDVGSMGSSEGVVDAALQSDGKLVVFGHADGGPFLLRYAASGALDPGFGVGGRLIDPVPFAFAGGMAIDAADRILIVGQDFQPLRYGIARFLPDGTPDSGFGNAGVVSTQTLFPVNDIVAGADGRIVVAGGFGSFGQGSIELVRYLSDGTLDGSFGLGGRVQTAVDPPARLATLSDGRMMVQGDHCFVRYLVDGTIDRAFGTDGVACGPGPLLDLVLGDDGRIVAGGGSTSFLVVSRDATGAADTRFGGDGEVTSRVPQNPLTAIVLESDGGVVATGPAGTGRDTVIALLRYRRDGSPDPTFGTSGIGIVSTTIGSEFIGQRLAIPQAMVIDPLNRITVVGRAWTGTQTDVALVRYLAGPTGTLALTTTTTTTTLPFGCDADAGAHRRALKRVLRIAHNRLDAVRQRVRRAARRARLAATCEFRVDVSFTEAIDRIDNLAP